ncbi:AAA family ATPase [Candidatus Neomarinimicrobiota bacterium]
MSNFLESVEHLEIGVVSRFMSEPALLNNGCTLEPTHFYNIKAQKVAYAINTILARDGIPDFNNVVMQLESKGQLQDVGGRAGLVGWFDYDSLDIGRDLKTIEQEYQKREAQSLLHTTLANLEGMELAELGNVAKQLSELSSGNHRQTPLTKIISGPVTLSGLLERNDDRPEDVITGLLPIESILQIYGVPKVGKSLLALNIAFHLAAGLPWFNLDIPKPQKVLYIGIEGGLWSLRDRVKAISGGWASPQDDMIHFWPVLAFDILSPAHYAMLESEVETIRPDIIMLDPLIKLHTSEENDNGAMQRVMDALRSLVVAKSRSLIFVHHSSKGSKQNRGSARGASSILGDVDCSIRLEWEKAEEHSGARRLYFEDVRHCEAPDSLYLELEPETLSFVCDKSGQGIVEQILSNGPMKGSELVSALKEQADKSQAWAYDQIRAAKKSGQIEVDKSSRKLRIKP